MQSAKCIKNETHCCEMCRMFQKRYIFYKNLLTMILGYGMIWMFQKWSNERKGGSDNADCRVEGGYGKEGF